MRKRKDSINVQEHLLPDGTMSSELVSFLRNAAAEMKKNVADHKQPPWIAFPGYRRGSMGWKMGAGEDYWCAFHSWICSLESSEVKEFVRLNPEPEGWQGFYDSIGLGR